MVIIAHVKKIIALAEKEIFFLNTLSPKDRLYIVTDANALIPISLFNVLAGLKTKPEVVSLPEGADSRAEAFLYGLITASVKTTEEVRILADMELSFPNIKNVKWVTTLAGTKTANRTAVKNIKPAAEKIVQDVSAESPSAKRVRKPKTDCMSKGNSLYQKISSYPSLEQYASLIKEKESDITYCIQNASEAEIGLKFLLETRLGMKDGDVIWEAIHADYESLKRLAEKFKK